MNQIKELKIRYNKDFKIEFTLLLLESQKKITISLIISEPVTVLELKEFISKDFDFPVKDLIIFYPLKGIMENSYIFNAEPNEKILLDLIYDDRKNDINNLNNDLRLKQNEYNNFQNTINFDYHIKENKNIITNIIKSDDKIKIDNSNQKLINPMNINKETFLFKNINFSDAKIDNNNKINLNINIEEKQKNDNIKMNEKNDLNHIKNNKCSFILTKIDDTKKISNDYLLGKKRNITTTFKTTILNKEKEDTKTKNIKLANNNNFKIVNFSINKNSSSQNE